MAKTRKIKREKSKGKSMKTKDGNPKRRNGHRVNETKAKKMNIRIQSKSKKNL